MLALTQTCPATDPNGLVRKLTGIKILNAQIISDEDAKGITDELVTAVRCNTEEAAKNVIVPAVLLGAAFTVIMTAIAVGRGR